MKLRCLFPLPGARHVLLMHVWGRPSNGLVGARHAYANIIQLGRAAGQQLVGTRSRIMRRQSAADWRARKRVVGAMRSSIATRRRRIGTRVY